MRLEFYRKEGKTILCERCENYYKGFNKCMKKEKGEINSLVYMGKWRALVGVEHFARGGGH